MNQSELVDIILGDLGQRTDMTSDCSAAISASVGHYQRIRFHFLETATAISMTSSMAYYSLPSNAIGNIDTMLITLSGKKQSLRRARYSDIDEKDDGATYGEPAEWCVFGERLRFYPVPDATYTFNMSYHMSLDPPTASGSNVWTQAAAQLIRHRAAWDVWANKLRNPEAAANSKSAEMEAFESLLGETTRKISTGFIKKSGW